MDKLDKEIEEFIAAQRYSCTSFEELCKWYVELQAENKKLSEFKDENFQEYLLFLGRQ